MTILQIHSVHALPGQHHTKYDGIAFDGVYFYCTVPGCSEIHQFDPCFSFCEPHHVCRPYSAICYDICNKCFWALPTGANHFICQLDCSLTEIGQIPLSLPVRPTTRLTGICYDSETNELRISAFNLLVRVCPCRRQLISCKRIPGMRNRYLCIEMLSSHCLFATRPNHQAEIALVSCNDELLLRGFLSCQYTPVDMVIKQTLPDCSNADLYILVVDSCNCCYVLQCIISGCCKDCGSLFEQDCIDLIESIALVEASLAHILNAEGEKLQKVIQTSTDFCEIMKTNDSVRHTICSVTELEKVLLKKLELASCICDEQNRILE